MIRSVLARLRVPGCANTALLRFFPIILFGIGAVASTAASASFARGDWGRGPAGCVAGLDSVTRFPDLDAVRRANNTSPSIAHLIGQLEPRPVKRPWGLRENARLLQGLGPRGGTGLAVALPKGSINPRHPTAPLGGMGWRWRPNGADGVRSACLVYHLYLQRGFAFARGGKLPGLFGGDAPAGGRSVDGRSGFSTRLMWRRGGRGEVYAYIPGHPARRGRSIGRGAWTFQTGAWVQVAQRVDLNNASASDGRIRVWIDGALRLDAAGLALVRDASVTIDGIMADVFYGGKSMPWSAPRRTFVAFSPFALHR
ncbi:MAG: polysaccharide lyase [Pseudomonadota bacterium]